MTKILLSALLMMMAVGAAAPAQAHEEHGYRGGMHMRVDEGYGRAYRRDLWRADEIRRREMWMREHRGYGYGYGPTVYVAPAPIFPHFRHWR